MTNSALIEDLEKQFAENPRRVFARLANEYRKSGDLDRAIEMCRKQVPLQPTYISGYIVLGQALFESGQLDEARTTFETALDLDPENLIALRHLGDIARDSGDTDGARSWYQRLLEVDPQNEEIAEQLRVMQPAGGATTHEAVSWNDIHPEHAEPAAPETAAPEPAPVEPPMLELSPAFPDIAAFAPAAAVPPELEPESAAAPEPFDLDLGALDVPDAAGAASPPPIPTTEPMVADAMAFDELEFPSADEIVGGEPVADAHPHGAVAGLDLDLEAGESAASPAAWEQGAAAGDEQRLAATNAFPDIDLSFEAIASGGAAGPAMPPAPEAEHAAPEERAPAMFVTETMAELYLQQGFRDRALDIYRQLATQRPADAALRERIAHLERGDLGAPDGARAPRSMRAFFAPFASRRPPEPALDADPGMQGSETEPAEAYHAELGAPAAEPDVSTPSPVSVASVPSAGTLTGLFGAREVRADDEAAASTLAAAFTGAGVPQETITGQPARAASDTLSLADVFGDARPRGEGGAPRAATHLSFDEFFARGEGGAAPEAEADDASASASSDDGGEKDLELFHAWLEGLKK